MKRHSDTNSGKGKGRGQGRKGRESRLQFLYICLLSFSLRTAAPGFTLFSLTHTLTELAVFMYHLCAAPTVEKPSSRVPRRRGATLRIRVSPSDNVSVINQSTLGRWRRLSPSANYAKYPATHVVYPIIILPFVAGYYESSF